jgi:hypothetical protein
MDQAATEVILELLRLRAELLDILRSPDADQRLTRWLLQRRATASVPDNPAPVHDSMPPA